MIEQIEGLRLKALQELASVNNATELEAWRVRYLGRNSELTQVLRSLATLPLEERKNVGGRANEVKSDLEDSFKQREKEIALTLTKR